jgi:putative flavoprotein involved in K+ transport
MADYLESYARHFELPVRNGIAVDRISKADGRLVVSAGDRRFEAENVVVATGAHRIPKLPAFAPELDPRIVQLHSSEYRGPSQLADGDVLLVGAGNSGAEIAFELAETRRCVLAGKSSGQIPVRHGTLPARLGFRVFRFFGHRVIRVDTRIGRKLGPKLLSKGDPLIRRREQDLAAAGVERVGRVVGVQDGLPVLEDGRVVDVANVIWCVGFRTDFGWIDLPVFDGDGQPRHYRGIVESEPGLFFLGLVFQYSASSDVLPSRGRDAEYIAKHIASRVAEGVPAAERALAAA